MNEERLEGTLAPATSAPCPQHGEVVCALPLTLLPPEKIVLSQHTPTLARLRRTTQIAGFQKRQHVKGQLSVTYYTVNKRFLLNIVEYNITEISDVYIE